MRCFVLFDGRGRETGRRVNSVSRFGKPRHKNTYLHFQHLLVHEFRPFQIHLVRIEPAPALRGRFGISTGLVTYSRDVTPAETAAEVHVLHAAAGFALDGEAVGFASRSGRRDDDTRNAHQP